MGKKLDNTITEQELQALEVRVTELINSCAHLKEENRMLRARQETLVQERSSLIEKTELAKSRVDSMITRLKALEVNS